MWNSPGFSKLTSNYTDILMNHAANAEWCEFLADKIRSIVEDPVTADKLIPKDHRVRREAASVRDRLLRGVQPTRTCRWSISTRRRSCVSPRPGIETTDGLREFDIIVWATGFDFGTGALNRMGVRGRERTRASRTTGWTVRAPILGIQCCGFPNFFFPGGPHGATGNNPRYGGDQVDFIDRPARDLMRTHGYDIVEVERGGRGEVDQHGRHDGSTVARFGVRSYFFGSNIPGKPRRYPAQPGRATEAARDHRPRHRRRLSRRYAFTVHHEPIHYD